MRRCKPIARILTQWSVTAAAFMLVTGTTAAQVTYQFNGSWGDPGNLFNQSFILTLDDYIVQDAIFSLQELAACQSAPLPCTEIHFHVVDINDPALSVIGFKSEYLTVNYYFRSEAFNRPGSYTMVYSDTFNPATLQVSGPAVPENPSAVLTSVGLLAGWAWRNRRRAMHVR